MDSYLLVAAHLIRYEIRDKPDKPDITAAYPEDFGPHVEDWVGFDPIPFGIRQVFGFLMQEARQNGPK